MARLVKRYANRKLYDVTERRYITLDEISELIQDGQEIQVVDKTSGDDITEQVLSKVIVASAQQPAGPLPKNVLVGLIQRPSDAFLGYVRKTFSAGVETVNQVDSFVKSLREFVRLDGHGPEAEELAPALRNVIEEFVQESVQERLGHLELASRGELERLKKQIRLLEQKIEKLQSAQEFPAPATVQNGASPARKRTSGKSRKE